MYLDTRLGFFPGFVRAPAAPRAAVAPAAPRGGVFSPLLSQLRAGAGFQLPSARLAPSLPRYGGTISLQPANVPIVSQAPAAALAPVSSSMDVPAVATQSLGPDSAGATPPADSSSGAPAAPAASSGKPNPLVLVAGGLVLLWALKGGKGVPTGKRGW